MFNWSKMNNERKEGENVVISFKEKYFSYQD